MNIIFLLLFFSVLIALVFLCAFYWSNQNGQFDDVEGPAMRILHDDRSNHTTNS